MKTLAHAHSVLIQNRRFRARFARKECGHFKEVGRTIMILYLAILNLTVRSSLVR